MLLHLLLECGVPNSFVSRQRQNLSTAGGVGGVPSASVLSLVWLRLMAPKILSVRGFVLAGAWAVAMKRYIGVPLGDR